MITAYHATKSEENFESIMRSKQLLPGYNVSTKQVEGVHLSLTPFQPGGYALDVIGEDTNEAWVFEVLLPDDTELLPDPSGDGKLYHGNWVVHPGTLAVKIVAVTHISNVQKWEQGGTRLTGYERRIR